MLVALLAALRSSRAPRGRPSRRTSSRSPARRRGRSTRSSRPAAWWRRRRSTRSTRPRSTCRGCSWTRPAASTGRSGSGTRRTGGASPAGATRSKPRALEVAPSARRGFLRRSPHDDRHLAFDDGSPWFAVGENLGWYDARGTFAYDSWLSRLAAQKANYARLWMPSWAMGIEWKDTGLRDYTNRLDRAWQLDHVLREAGRRGIEVMLSIQNHGQFSTVYNSAWADNPYNAANGGPLALPQQFFTDPTARELFKRRLRYIVARWGHATNLLAWELWNEADLTDRYRSTDSLAWHREMVDWLRALDPHDHLVSTSFSLSLVDNAVWTGAGLDFTQIHFYSLVDRGGAPVVLGPNLAENVVAFTAARRAIAALPILFAEIGVDARGPAETRANDPDGIGVHDGLWAGVVSGGFGTAMTWWWDNLIDVEPDLQGDGAFVVWIKDDEFQWYAPQSAPIADGVLALDDLPPGPWCGRWYDPWAGAWGAAVLPLAGGGPVALPVPEFSRDLALRLRRCPTP
jgi:hypothetical protein